MLLKALEKLASLLARLSRQDDDDFVSAVTGDHITVAGDPYQLTGHILEQGIPAFVAVTVVDDFKIVQVKKCQGQRTSVALRPFELPIQHRLHDPPVQQAGKAVSINKLYISQELVYAPCV
jgi:hypothetical protein